MFMMQHADYLTIAPDVIRQIKNGAFLTVQSGDQQNVMTIGWGSIGFMWGRPMLSIMVRSSRFTSTIIEKSSEFTVSVPMTDMKRELEVCGSVSGKKVDKFQECKLDLIPGQKVKTPLIQMYGYNFECEIVYRSKINSTALTEAYTHLYPSKDYHTIYYGEIKYCYSTIDE